jgi:acyl-coenzyme A thioesterase PaaI-like protein
VTGYILDESTPEQIRAEGETYGPIAQELRELAGATIRTTVAPEVAAEALARLREARELLTSELGGATYGVRFDKEGKSRAWGNAVVGLRNAVAPPLDVQVGTLPDGHEGVWAEFDLGAQYEGPPTLVHGGVSALILDQILGQAAAEAGKPGMTGTLTIRYRKGTALGRVRAQARVDRVEGVKTFAVGHLETADGVTVEAEGVFILPRWAREKSGPGDKPLRFD